jgi:hypothetical protein
LNMRSSRSLKIYLGFVQAARIWLRKRKEQRSELRCS